MSASLRDGLIHGRVVKGVDHLGRDEATEVRGREFAL